MTRSLEERRAFKFAMSLGVEGHAHGVVEHHSTRRGHQGNGAHAEGSVLGESVACTARSLRHAFETPKTAPPRTYGFRRK